MAADAATTGAVRVEKVLGRSTLTRCFARYTLKLIAPSKVGPASCDAVWLYALTYGGGIVSGDTISCTVSVGDGCTAAITTQASTKVYRAVGSKCSEQFLEVMLLHSSDPQSRQGLEKTLCLFLFQILRKLKHMQDKKQDEVRELMSGQLRPPTSGGSRYAMRSQAQQPPLIASCSPFGRAGAGTVAGLAAADTESIYAFLKHHLAGTRAVPWRFALPFVMKLTDRLRHSTGLR